MFAKLFDDETHGQLLVKFDQDEIGRPEVRLFCEPENLGVCSTALSWDDAEDDWTNAQAVFDEMTQETARQWVERFKTSLPDLSC